MEAALRVGAVCVFAASAVVNRTLVYICTRGLDFNELFTSKVSKAPMCLALYNEQLTSNGAQVWQRGITQFYLPTTSLSTSGMNHTCLYSPAAERHRTLAGTHFPAR